MVQKHGKIKPVNLESYSVMYIIQVRSTQFNTHQRTSFLLFLYPEYFNTTFISVFQSTSDILFHSLALLDFYFSFLETGYFPALLHVLEETLSL